MTHLQLSKSGLEWVEQRKPTEISYMRKNRLKISFQKNIEIKVVSKEMGEVGGGVCAEN